jgi:hypothetical protein
MTVKISSSIGGAPFGWYIVVADTALFIVNEISVLPMENLRRCKPVSGKGATRDTG